MTTLAVLADIHGNLPALDAVLSDIQAQGGVDQVVIAGDVVNWGPFSAQVMARLEGEAWAVIRGNNEYYLLEYRTPRQPEHWQQFTLLPWLYEQLEGRWHQRIAAWPDELSLRFPDAPPLRVFHASPGDPWHGLPPQLSHEALTERLKGIAEPVIITAHTHLAMDRRVNGWQVINPGTVGVPLDGRPGVASYALLEGHEAGWTVVFRKVAYDIAPLLAEFERQRFVERFGVVARLVVREFESGRLEVHPFNHWRQQNGSGDESEVALLAAFDHIDKWAYTPLEYHVNLDV